MRRNQAISGDYGWMWVDSRIELRTTLEGKYNDDIRVLPAKVGGTLVLCLCGSKNGKFSNWGDRWGYKLGIQTGVTLFENWGDKFG